MKVLLHICCAPCAAYPVEYLKKKGVEVTGFWYNPNIHPYLEYRKRLHEVRRLSRIMDFPLVERDIYNLVPYLSAIINRPKNANRCDVCYHFRLTQAARYAAEANFDAFTTTLLYSKYQRHESIKRIGEELAEKFGIKFFYADFREGWSRGLKLSRKFKLYRQQYCGCIISELERFYKNADLVLEHFEWKPRLKKSVETKQ